MKKILFAVIISIATIAGFVPLCILGFNSIGLAFIFPAIIGVLLIWLINVLLWDDSDLKKVWKQHLLSCKSLLVSNV